MPEHDAREWLAMLKLANVVRSTVLDAGYVPDSCVLCSKVTHEVLLRYGVRSKPTTVRWYLMNREWLDHIEELAASGWDHTLFPGAWSIGVGVGEDNAPEDGGRRVGWAGHLAVVTEGGWLIDPSLDQASRPEKGIVVAPLALPLPGGAIPEEGMDVPIGAGRAVLYPSLRSVPKRSKDWQDPGKWRPLVDRVMEHEALRLLLRQL